LLDISTVLKRYGTASRQERARALDPALHAFNSVRNRELGLYPNVKETLEVIGRGSVIVAHTEASSANAVFRLRKLGIAHLLDRLYAIEDAGPGHPEAARVLEYKAVAEKVRRLSAGERKPDPQVLLDICRDYDVPVDATLYVGDSISRDIGMARAAGVWSAWAKYGTMYDPAYWRTLVRVTHWTADDVARAQKAEEMYGASKPDVVLNQGFDELLEHFSFVGVRAVR
jgi:phosphoglycolate phosphatase